MSPAFAAKKLWALNAVVGGLVAVFSVKLLYHERYAAGEGFLENHTSDMLFVFLCGFIGVALIFPIFWGSLLRLKNKCSLRKYVEGFFTIVLVGPFSAFIAISLFFLILPFLRDGNFQGHESALWPVIAGVLGAFVAAPISIFFGVFVAALNLSYINYKNFFVSETA